MNVAPERLAALSVTHPGARLMDEGGDLIFLPKLQVRVGDQVRELDALLCPREHSGYPTRLFFEEPITERPTIAGNAANWSTHNILGRTWHTWSWRDVSASQPLTHILRAHLRALL